MADFGIEGLQALSIQINNALKEQGIISQEIIDNHQPASQQEVQRIYAQGYQAWLADDYVTAMADFSWLTIHCPLEFRFHLALAGAMQMQQEYALALSAYTCALLLEAKDPEPVYQMAICLRALEKGADAREALQTAIEMSYLSPEYASIAEKASLLLNQI